SSLLFLLCYAPLRDLHSFPTRRSSDLFTIESQGEARESRRQELESRPQLAPQRHQAEIRDMTIQQGKDRRRSVIGVQSDELSYRSEEHTSELQSRGHLVCRLLLEKKKE